MLLIGVDEAGYGPLLGPLVVAGSAFRLPAQASVDSAASAGRWLRDALGPAAVDPTVRPHGRLVVGDSKQVHGGSDLAALERGVLAFAGATGEVTAAPRDLDELLSRVGVVPQDRRRLPWYAREALHLPCVVDADDVGGHVHRLRRTLDAAGAAFVGYRAQVVLEDRYNAAVQATANKAETLFDLSASVFEALLTERRPGEDVVVVFDRQGGRRNYLPPMQRRWPAAFTWRLSESPARSAYRLSVPGGAVAVEYCVKADADAPQVGLASMLAKYLRETFMGLWNDWFGALCPRVRPTAGYTTDGRRWLTETREERARAGIPDDTLVRIR